MRLAEGTLADLTAAINEAIDELSAPVTHADGTQAAATSSTNGLINWYRCIIPLASETFTSTRIAYNRFASQFIISIMVAERSLTENARYTSPSASLPAYTTQIGVELVSTNWVSYVGLGSITWGIEYSQNGGTSWTMAVQTTFPLGVLNKGSIMPSIGASRIDTITGASWRFYLTSTANIDAGLRGYYRSWQ